MTRQNYVLVHGYDVLDHDITWAIVREKLPILIPQLERLLRENQQGTGAK